MPSSGEMNSRMDHDFILTTVQAVRSQVQDVGVAAESLHRFILAKRTTPMENVHRIALLKYLTKALNGVRSGSMDLVSSVTQLEHVTREFARSSQAFYELIYGL